jgi:hypothetical protein
VSWGGGGERGRVVFEAWRERKARAAAARVAAVRATATGEVHALEAELQAATSADEPDAASTGAPFTLARGEQVVGTAQGVGLVEPRRQPGHYQGSSRGVSVRVPGTRSMRYRVGANRGTFVPGPATPTRIDVGSFTVTSTRAVFVGDQQTREWSWAKLLGVTHHDRPPWTAIAVSNREKVSGVLYDAVHARTLAFWIDLAVARAHGTQAELAARVRGELDSARARAGPAPNPGPASPGP